MKYFVPDTLAKIPLAENHKIVIPSEARELLPSAAKRFFRFSANGRRIRAAMLLGGALSVIFLLASILLLSVHAAADEPTPTSPLVSILHIDGDVEPILATYLDEGLTDAAQRHAALVVITMDTPGGLSDSMKEIVQHILASPVAVAVYVTPNGARGASAGFYILLSADIAAMAPGTHIGAASPIMVIGGIPAQLDEVFRKKINQDAMAFLRSFTEKRGRNPVLAETAISEAKAFTEKEALDAKMIDLVANNVDDLLAKLDGRSITRFDGSKVTLALHNPTQTSFELSSRQKFLARIVEPDIFFVLLIVGVLGLYTEFTHPGVIAPGVIGGISLVLALYAMHFLPVNLAGVFLILLALAFFIMEAKYTSHGVLVAGGIVSMLLGAMFLIRSPLTGFGVSFFVALAVTLPFALIAVFLMRLVLRSRRWKPATGKEELLGEQGVVVEPLPAGAEGIIRIHGELWRAISEQAVGPGNTVRVLRIEGLQLFVEPVKSS
jgi:membrane-bound serine protease (ClpP class)